MPLSRPVPRQHIHTRAIECHGYLREDNLWDIEGTLTDLKTYTFDNIDRNGVVAGEPIHKMVVRLTVDEDLLVQNAEAFTAASPYLTCSDANSNVPNLAGLQIGPGWRAGVKKVMGRTLGCTHIRDLIMGPIALTAYQSIIPWRNRKTQQPPGDNPAILGTCHAYATDGPIVERLWPQHFTGKRQHSKSD